MFVDTRFATFTSMCSDAGSYLLGIAEAGKDQLRKNIGGHIAATPLRIELLGGRCCHGLIHCFSRADESLNPFPDLYQHVTILLEIRTSGHRSVARNNFRLLIRPSENLIDGMDNSVD